MNAGEPKRAPGAAPAGASGRRPSHLASLGVGLLLGALGGLPALLPGCDAFAFLFWIACTAAGAGALAGARGIDPLRFGAVAPALWAVALALITAGELQASLASPAYGAAAWTGIFFAGMGVGALAQRAAASAAALVLLSALLVGLPGRGGLPGAPWAPQVASLFLDSSPFVLLGECSGVRDLAWHPSLYTPAGTDRFERAPWNGLPTGFALLGLGFAFAWAASRRRALPEEARAA